MIGAIKRSEQLVFFALTNVRFRPIADIPVLISLSSSGAWRREGA